MFGKEINKYSGISFLYKKRGIGIVVLLAIQSFLDFFSLAAFVPVFLLIVKPDIIEKQPLISGLYKYFDFQSQRSLIVALSCLVLVFIIAKNVLSLWITRLKAKYAFEIGHRIASEKISSFMTLGFLNYTKIDFSKELNRFTNYPIAFANNIILPSTVLFSEMLVSALILTSIAIYDYKLFVLVLVIQIPAMLLFRLRKKKLKSIGADMKEKYPLLLKYANQIIEGFIELRTYRTEGFFKKRFDDTSRDLSKTFTNDHSIQTGTTRLAEIVVGFVVCLIIVYSVVTQQQYQETLILLGLYLGASFRVIPSLNRIVLAMQQIRVHDYLFEELEPIISPVSENTASPVTHQFKKEIEFNHVSFGYPEGSPIVNNVSLTIRKGECVAITGKSGEGKTTLLLLLLGFLKENSGRILLDGEALESGGRWNQSMGYVPQNPYILDDTLASNIAFGVPSDEVDRTKVNELIDELELNDLITNLSEGIDTRIGERGVKLSGGQRQRLSIARALYRDTEILLLDEITNQLHPSLELEILNLLEKLSKKGRTIILVTHKIADARIFSSIYQLNKGKLVEAEPAT